MASKKEQTPEAPMGFWAKYALLFDKVQAAEIQADMSLGTGARATSYANTQQYKVIFAQLVRECGLVFTTEYWHETVVNALMPTRDGDKTIFLATVNATLGLTDPDTGDGQTWGSTGSAKNEAADHASLGAKTYAFRGWFTNNFLLNNAHDEKYERNSFAELGGEVKTTTKKESSPAVKGAKASTPVRFAEPTMVADIGKKLAKLRKTDPTAGDKFLAKYGTVAEDGSFTLDSTEIPYAKAVSTLQNIKEKLEAAAGGAE